MKKFISIALLAVVLPCVAVAGNGKGHDPDRQVEKLTKKLDLTPEQQEEARAILIDAKTKNDALAEKYNLKAYKAEKRELDQASQKAISDILTPEQHEKMGAMKKNKKQKKQEN